jgi:pyruvate-formate lyase-activating enzyme
VELRPTLACNHHCGFCNSVDRTIENVTQGIDDLRDGIDVWAAMPVYRTTVSGGEPTLLRGLPELLEMLADRGLVVELQTNGMALADPAYAQRLRDAGVHTVLVSLHASDPSLSDDHITLHDGAWGRTVAGIDNALEYGITVEISHVVHRANHQETLRFMEFVHARWGRRVRVRLAFVAPTGGAADATEQCVPPLHETLPGVRAALAYAREHHLRVGMVGYCGLPPCLLQPYEWFSEITRRRATDYPDNHVKFAACRSCVYDRSCPGIWQGYHETYGDPGIESIVSGPWLPRPVRWLLYELTS